MDGRESMWSALVFAAATLAQDGGSFRGRDIVWLARQTGPSYDDTAYRDMLNTMVVDAPGTSATPVGKVFRLVGPDLYRFAAYVEQGEHQEASESSSPTRTGLPRKGSGATSKEIRLQRRLDKLISEFDDYVGAYDLLSPFNRPEQLELHRATIDRRRALGHVEAALDDDEFLSLLYDTLYSWGIGKRRSRRVSLEDFGDHLRLQREDIESLDGLFLEDPDLPLASTLATVWRLIGSIRVVDNMALVVAGTKTLHHLLPDLVPPMDRAWTGMFFGWSPLDPQSRQQVIFSQAFVSMARVAQATTPSRLVGRWWRTSSTKLIDNAIIAYCKTHLMDGAPLPEPAAVADPGSLAHPREQAEPIDGPATETTSQSPGPKGMIIRTDPRPTWQLVLQVVRDLTDQGRTPFRLSDIIEGVQMMDPSRDYHSIQPVVQGMTRNAGKGPRAPSGYVLHRTDHGWYRMLDAVEDDDPVDPQAGRGPSPQGSADNLIPEDEVRAAVWNHLKAHRYLVVVAWGNARGVEAHNDEERLLVAVKGESASRQQQQDNFVGALGELLQCMDEMPSGSSHYGLALPDNPHYRELASRLPQAAWEHLHFSVDWVRRTEQGIVVSELWTLSPFGRGILQMTTIEPRGMQVVPFQR